MRLETLEQIRELARSLNAARPVDIAGQAQIEELAEQANVVANAAPVGLFLYFAKLRGLRVIEIEDEYAPGPVALIVEVHNAIGSTWDLYTPDRDG